MEILKEYGKPQLSDLYNEHCHQGSEMEIGRGICWGIAQFDTDALLEKIRTEIIHKYEIPALDDVDIKPRELAVAHFLFKMGFIIPRNGRLDEAPLNFIRFGDRPHLLSRSENRDDGLLWEIHQSYRTVLRIGEPGQGQCSAGHRTARTARPTR